MQYKKVKWLIYTVLVGLIPILCRVLVWSVTKNDLIEVLNAADIVVFGLVLHISNINEIEHLFLKQRSWKTTYNGISIAFISFYSVLFALTLFSDTKSHFVDKKMLTYFSISLGLVSFVLSYSIYYRASKIPEGAL